MEEFKANNPHITVEHENNVWYAHNKVNVNFLLVKIIQIKFQWDEALPHWGLNVYRTFPGLLHHFQHLPTESQEFATKVTSMQDLKDHIFCSAGAGEDIWTE
jgi:hypothetical protein